MTKADVQLLVYGEEVRVLINGHLIDTYSVKLVIEKNKTPRATIEIDVSEVVITGLEAEIGE